MPWQPQARSTLGLNLGQPYNHTIHAFPGIRDKPQLNLNPLWDSFCKPKFRTVPDVSGPVEGMCNNLATCTMAVIL